MKKFFVFIGLFSVITYAQISYGDKIHVPYAHGNGYDAVVQDIRGDRLLVKVIDVQLGYFTLLLKPSTCSGHEELQRGDRKIFWIPKYCVD